MQSIILPKKPCGQISTPVSVDLVVIIDTSGSMADEATALSEAAEAAIQAAAASCPSDLRVIWFGVEGVWPDTNFAQSYRSYLHGLDVPDADIVGTPGDREDGAAAIVDISDHFDWRPNAARTIFYLSDEGLEGGHPQDAADVAAADRAIATARSAQVKVFTYAGTGAEPATAAEFARVARETGGQGFAASAANLDDFQTVLRDIICATIVRCDPVEIPAIEPCFEICRASEADDPLQTNDVEVLAIVAYNPYSNITFKGLTVFISLTTADGQPIETLPDGLPSVFIKPANSICFGDLLPCHPDRPRDLTRIMREVVLVTREARSGAYLVKLDYYFSLELIGANEFEVQLATS